MNRDYVAPRPADPVWADVIVLATPADSSREVESYVATLPALGPMTGKMAAPLAPGEDGACDGVVRGGRPCRPHLRSHGRAVTGAAAEPDLHTRARLHGQRLVQLARAMKTHFAGE